jgi:hypothetical protein
MNIAWRVMRRDQPQMLSCMHLRITGTASVGTPGGISAEAKV